MWDWNIDILHGYCFGAEMDVAPNFEFLFLLLVILRIGILRFLGLIP